MHPAALPAGVGPHLFDGLPKAKRAIGDRQLRANRQPTPLQIEEQFSPRLRTLAHTVGEADKLLPALGCGSDDDQQALRGVFETGLHVNAVDPEVDVAFGREIALAPARVLLGRQNRRRKADALATFAAAVTHARAAHSDRTNPGYDLTLGQMSVAHHQASLRRPMVEAESRRRPCQAMRSARPRSLR